MAKEECFEQWSKTGDVSTLRKRNVCPPSERTPITPQSEDKNPRTTSKDDPLSSNGTCVSAEPVSRLLLLGLSFSTRLYKITEPPHVWWVKPLRVVSYCGHTKTRAHSLFTQWLFVVFQLGWDALREDGKLLHQQDLLFRRPSSSWKSETVDVVLIVRLHVNLSNRSIDLLPVISCRCW